MDSNELAEIFPGLIANYLDEASAPMQVQPDLILAHPSWSFMSTGSILTVGRRGLGRASAQPARKPAGDRIGAFSARSRRWPSPETSVAFSSWASAIR